MSENNNLGNNTVIEEQIEDQKVDSQSYQQLEVKRINELCDIILVNEDSLDTHKGKKYIEDLIENNVNLQGDKNKVRFYVLNSISKYIDNCPTTIQLFAFASNNNFYGFRLELTNHYYNYSSKYKSNVKIEFPQVLDYVFDCIQEAIDTHTLFQKFSIKMSNDYVHTATQFAVETSQKAIATANNAENSALLAAKKAADEAIKLVIEHEQVEKQIADKVDKQMSKVTSRISETSVTILGIFSAIVLTIVAGLFYSSSVLDNINSANFFRLVGISALIGFICLHLMVAMFRFIGKLSGKTIPSDNLTISVSILLIVIMLAGFILQFIFPLQMSFEKNDITDANASSHTNVSYSELYKD